MRDQILELLAHAPRRRFAEIHAALKLPAWEFRLLDRELQKMRKAGLVMYVRGRGPDSGWDLVKKQEVP